LGRLLRDERRQPVSRRWPRLRHVRRVGGGTGAHRAGDGLDGVDTYMSNVGLMPVEVAEAGYRVRILRTELIPGSQGTGAFSGGLGLRREYQILDVAQTTTFYSEQTDPRFRPRGARGGRDGSPA